MGPEKTDTTHPREEEPPDNPPEQLENAAQERPAPNGGLEGWLSVLAGFCVFVNSW